MRVLLLDGALGTELENRIPKDSDSHPSKSSLWSGKVLLELPELIQQVHLDYIESGSDLITTSTYQISYPRLKDNGLNESQIHELWQKSINVASAAVKSSGKDVKIIGSIGPFGSYVNDGSEYTGKYSKTKQQLREHHQPMVNFMTDSSEVDIIGFETVPNFEELLAIMDIMKYKSKPFFVSMQINEKGLVDATTFSTITEQFNLPNLEGIGINCIDYNRVTDYLTELDKYNPTKIPYIIYPNYGFFQDEDGKYSYQTNIKKWKSYIKLWLTFNVKMIGGCCSTSPKEIRAIKDVY